VRVLGVDPGSVNTGYGVIDIIKGKLSLVEQGAIRCSKIDELPNRLVLIYSGLLEVIQRTAPQVVAIEAPFAGKSMKSLIQLAHARGVALLAARNAGLEIAEYAPKTIKSAVVGYGSAEKEQVERMVRLLIPEVSKLKMSADAADALAVAICHAHSAKMQSIGKIALR
jgi:crossover junction endodeoxyribonuclease RuvC